MQLSDLKHIIHSLHGDIQLCIVYDQSTDLDLEHGCSVEYAYKHYGNRIVKRVSAAYEQGMSYIVFTIYN